MEEPCGRPLVLLCVCVCVCVFVGMLMLGWSVSLECLLFGSEMPFDCFCCEPRFVFLDHFIIFPQTGLPVGFSLRGFVGFVS